MVIGDKYFKLYNNGNDPIELKGVAIVESAQFTVMNLTLVPDSSATHFAVHSVYRIPVSPDKKLAVGASIIICDNGKDHRPNNAMSINLSNANYEWFDEGDFSGIPAIDEQDNPGVPNLEKLFSYSATVWTPHSRGFVTFAIVDTEEYNTKADFDAACMYTYKLTENHPSTMEGRKIKYGEIIDVVSCGNKPGGVYFSPFPTNLQAGLDQGHAHCFDSANKPQKGHAIVRKAVGTTGKYQDTNNSTNDFEIKSIKLLNPTLN